MWLLWRYTNTVNGAATSVYYPIAKSNWKVDWAAYASAGSMAGPIDRISLLHGVTADANYTRTNQPPDTMSPTTTVNGQQVPNTFNQNNSWVDVN